MQKKIVGTWILESFEIENHNGERRDWGQDVRGLLIYTPGGRVSVSINRKLPEDSDGAQAILDSLLFYAGNYSVEGNTIHHKVTLASNPERIGKDMIRFAQLDGDLLTLTTPKESYGTAILKWRKEK